MRHWDGRDRDDGAALPLTRQERERLRALFRPAPGRPKARPHMGSLIGVTLAFAVLAGLAVLLGPSDPISSKVLN